MRAWRNFALVGAFALTAALPVSTARAGDLKDLLKLVPDDAWGFAVAKSLDNLDTKTAQITEALGLPLPGKPSEMALGMLQLGDTIDKTSPVCIVMLDAQKFNGANNALVLLVPATDPKGLLEKLSAEEEKEGVSKCTIMGEPSYAAVKGKVVMLSPSEDCLSKFSKSNKPMTVAPARLGVMTKSDVYISVAMHSIVGAFKDMVMPMIQMMTASSGMNPKDMEKFVKACEEVLAFDIAMAVDKTGVSLTFLAAPIAGSDLEAVMGETKNSSDPLLNLLPRERFLFTMGATGNKGEASEKFGSEHPLSGLIKAVHQGAEMDAKALEELDAQFIKLQKSIKSYAASLDAASGSDGLVTASFVAETSGSKEFVEGVRKLYKAMSGISEDEDAQAFMKNIVHTPDAETIGGKKVDTIKVDVSAIHGADKDDAKHFQVVFGKDTAIRFGAADDKRVVISIGGGADRYAKVAAAAKSAEKMPSDVGITEASSSLPSPRSAEAFIAVDTIVSVIKQGMKSMGQKDESMVELPTLNAPVAFSSCTQDKITRIDLMVPMKLIKAGKEAYEKFAATSKDEDFDKDEDEAPAAKKKAVDKKKKAKGDEDEDEEPPAKSKAKPEPKKPKAAPKKPEKKNEDESDE